jgi:3-hydroxy-9,10-secoandrosta-1,3,5(10)-triene-9,17-dione monooxygenase
LSVSPNPDIARFSSRAAALDRTRALVPALRERAEQAEALRRLPDATVADLHRAGLFRILQPARVGGGEHDYGLLIEVAAELARGCGSTAWVCANLASHHWMLAMWPKAAQDAVWRDPDALIASSVVFPAGRAVAVDGGYRLSGRWPFSSGIDASGWVMLGALVRPRGEGAAEARMLVVPKSELEVIDTWDVAGLAGTGSKDVAAADVFVADPMTLLASAVRGGPNPGSADNPAPLFQLPVLALFPHIVAAPALGMAEGALDCFVDANRSAQSTYNASRLAEHVTIHLKVAEAGALIAAARLLLRDNCAEAHRIYDAGGEATAEQKHRWRRDGAYAGRLAAQAIDILYGASGGRGVYRANPMQRYFRDVHAAVAHIGLSWDINGVEYGRIALGLAGNPGV